MCARARVYISLYLCFYDSFVFFFHTTYLILNKSNNTTVLEYYFYQKGRFHRRDKMKSLANDVVLIFYFSTNIQQTILLF